MLSNKTAEIKVQTKRSEQLRRHDIFVVVDVVDDRPAVSQYLASYTDGRSNKMYTTKKKYSQDR